MIFSRFLSKNVILEHFCRTTPYKSRFATSCNSLDRLEFKSYTDNFSTPAAAAFADGDKILESKICAHSSSYASKSFDFGHWVDQETCAGNASCMNCGEEFTSKKSYRWLKKIG